MYEVSFAVDSRAEYGIVRKYLKLLDADSEIAFSLLATGAFVDQAFGNQVELAQSDGFSIAYELHLPDRYSTTADIIKRMSKCLDSFGAYFESTHPDLLIVLGDRYEMLAVSIAAAMHRIPILHLHGGEATYANYDEFIRHSITKMSTFHFVSCEEHRKRVIQLGEHPDRVFNMGSLGAENCTFISEDSVSPAIRRLSDERYCVVLFHPETLSDSDVVEQTYNLFEACNMHADLHYIFLGSNADTHADKIRELVRGYVDCHDHATYFESLSSDDFLYLLKHSQCLIGNSSSGIIEAPSLGIFTVNIGDRQKGRVRASSVIDVPCDSLQIADAIGRACACKGRGIDNPYYQYNAAKKYYEKTKELLEFVSARGVEPKEFYDSCLSGGMLWQA
ncbi:MAG: UDP-N-acetylglucosamine 2-epimerase [Coriobacteriales bacterium]